MPELEQTGLVGKAYASAGQATACLHTMAVLQVYQADLLGDLDSGGEMDPDAVGELQTWPSRPLKRQAERWGAPWHHWLSLSELQVRDRAVLLNFPSTPTASSVTR